MGVVCGGKRMRQKLGISNQDKIKLEHQRLVYGLFRDGPAYSCTDIARATGLSNTAAANIVKNFLDLGMIRPSERSVRQGKGRPLVFYELNPAYGLVAAVDLTDSDLVICVSDMKMQILCCRKIHGCTRISQDILGQVVAVLRNILQENAAKFGKYSAICIGTPGKIDPETGYFACAPKFIDYRSVNLRKIFAEAFGAPIILKNDVKLALQGESYFGSAIAKRNVVYLHIDDHYGGAIKLGGTIFEGERGYAGEFGGVRVLEKQKHFCYASYGISLGGMLCSWQDHVRNRGELPEKSGLLTVENLIEQYKNGEEEIVKIVEDAAEITAVEILNIATVLDVPTFILDGKIKLLGDEYLEKIRRFIVQYDYLGQNIQISYSLLQGRAAILGGLRCAIDAVSDSMLSRC